MTDAETIIELRIELACLKTENVAIAKALELAQSNTHVVVAQLLSIGAILVSVYAVMHR